MKINESLLCPQLQTTDERQQDVNNIMILSRKKMTRKLTPKPSLLCQRSIHVDNRNIPTCTTNEIQYTKGTSWGSIFNRKSITISPTTNKKAAFTKRRSGLVRRTHSPVNMPSPVTKPASQIFFPTTKYTILQDVSMGSKAAQINEGLSPPLLCSPDEISRPKGIKKRKRSQSPKSRIEPPNGRQNCTESSTKEHRMDLSCTVKVKIVSPTLRGVMESAKILRYGIFSFPTETLYSLVSFVSCIRRSNVYDDRWESLIRLKNKKENDIIRNPLMDPPLLYIHRPDYANNYISFSRPKTFIFKQKPEDDKPGGDATDKFTAVTFSESHEVLKRLASAFWPGPVTIFAPVRKLKKRSRSFGPLPPNVVHTPDSITIQHQAKSSCSSLISLTSESSEEQMTSPFINDCNNGESLPILPLSALLREEDITDKRQERSNTYFVGMRCPSHPLANRILSEFYGNQDKMMNESPSKSHKRFGAVLGFNASVDNNGKSPFSCRDTCSNLLSIQERSSPVDFANSTIHVMNGEDRREMFTVPASQYGESSLVSLVIDAPNRTVFLHRNTSHLGSNEKNGDFELPKDTVKRALCYSNIDDPGCVKSRAITAVMHKWSVIEITS